MTDGMTDDQNSAPTNENAKATCSECGAKKAHHICGPCGVSLCKYCAQYLDDSSFAFLPERTELTKFSTYCPSCFNLHVEPKLAEYNELVEKAKGIEVFEKSQGKESRLVERLEKPVSVENCDDKHETVLRLAFLSARMGYNGLVDLSLNSKKVKIDGYQKTSWSGSGIPAQIEPHMIIKDRSFWQHPN